MIPTTYYMILCAMLFVAGALGAILRRNALVAAMCVALMFCAAALVFAIGARVHDSISGQVWGVLVVVATTAELCVGGALLLALFRSRKSLDMGRWKHLKW